MYVKLIDLTCSECAELDGKKFKYSEMQAGVSAPPIHPNDRCTIIPVVDERPIEDDEISLNNVDNESESGIINNRNVNSLISLPIEQRNTGKGNPNAILLFGTSLNNRQKIILDNLPAYDSRKIFNKKNVSMSDLSALTAITGDEFAMFTKRGKRLIVRGNRTGCKVDIEEAKRLSSEGYKWSGHTSRHRCLFITSI